MSKSTVRFINSNKNKHEIILIFHPHPNTHFLLCQQIEIDNKLVTSQLSKWKRFLSSQNLKNNLENYKTDNC